MYSYVVEVLPFTNETADRFSLIRAETAARPADAIDLAAASQAGVEIFLTNDKRLQKLKIKDISFIAGLDVNVF